MTTDCPICLETVKAFVTLECEHKLCLECYHKCIQHSHKNVLYVEKKSQKCKILFIIWKI